MDLGLRDKVAIVAGGSRGIGRAVALTLAAEGCRVVLAARGKEALRQAAAEVEAAGVRVLAFPCDLTKAEAAQRLVSAAMERFGRIDALVNSIHFSAPGDDDSVWEQ